MRVHPLRTADVETEVYGIRKINGSFRWHGRYVSQLPLLLQQQVVLMQVLEFLCFPFAWPTRGRNDEVTPAPSSL